MVGVVSVVMLFWLLWSARVTRYLYKLYTYRYSIYLSIFIITNITLSFIPLFCMFALFLFAYRFTIFRFNSKMIRNWKDETYTKQPVQAVCIATFVSFLYLLRRQEIRWFFITENKFSQSKRSFVTFTFNFLGSIMNSLFQQFRCTIPFTQCNVVRHSKRFWA